MTRKHYSIDQLSTATSRQAQSEITIMRRELSKLRDSISTMSPSIKRPVIKATRKWIKKTASQSSLFNDVFDKAVNGISADLLGEAGVGGTSASATQTASRLLTQIASGQRIR